MQPNYIPLPFSAVKMMVEELDYSPESILGGFYIISADSYRWLKARAKAAPTASPEQPKPQTEDEQTI